MDADGKAFGILSTLNLEPAPGTNGVGDLGKELAYANEHGGDEISDVSLENGTSAFHPPLPLPALGSSAPRADQASDSDSDDSSDASTATDNNPAQSAAEGAHRATPDRGLSIAPRQPEPAPAGAPKAQPGALGGL
jgi:hypothetical protein